MGTLGPLSRVGESEEESTSAMVSSTLNWLSVRDLCLALSTLSFRLGGLLGTVGVSLGLGLDGSALGTLDSFPVNNVARFSRDFPS